MPSFSECIALILPWLWTLGLIGAVGIPAAGIYVYLFQKAPEWSKFTLWLTQAEQLPAPYGLRSYSFPQTSEKVWTYGAWLSLILSGVGLYLWLSQLGFDPIRSVLGVWFLTWLPGFFGRSTTEIGHTEPFGFALMLAAMVTHAISPVLSVAFALTAAVFLPIAPILVALSVWSPWPLIGMGLPIYQELKIRKVELPKAAPPEVLKNLRLAQKFGFGAGRSDQLRNPQLMVWPWGSLAVLFLYALGQSADLELLYAAIGALVVSYGLAFWSYQHTINALLAACPVIACALMCEDLEWILLAAFLLPFTASEGVG